jgi:cystathionine beta-lyase
MMAQAMAKSKPDLSTLKPETRLVAAGRQLSEHGFVNPAVYHASTVLFDDVDALHDKHARYRYARRGSPTSLAVETAIAALDGGHATKVASSGLAAIAMALLAFHNSGDHLLMVDAV